MKRTFLGAVATAALLAAGTASAQDIRVGALYPTSGGGAIYGGPAMEGHNMAVEEINAMGGINGRKLVTVVRDTKLNPATAASAAKEMITKDNVDIILGGVSSAVGLAISEVAKQEGVVYIATIPKTIQMTTSKLHPHVFRTSSNTDFEGDAIAQLVAKVGGTKVCDIQPDYAYGHDLAKGIKAGLARHAPDAEIVMNLWPKLGATDYNVFVTQLMGSGCDVVTSGLWGSNFVNFAQQASPFGFFNQIKAYISGGEIASHEVAGKMGDDYPPNVISNTYELWYDNSIPGHKAFQEKVAMRSGTKETAMWPVLAYIGVQFYAEAVKKSGGTDDQGIIKALEGMTIDTPVGSRTINAADHQANTGQFWGPMVKREGFNYKVMHPVTYIPAEIN